MVSNNYTHHGVSTNNVFSLVWYDNSVKVLSSIELLRYRKKLISKSIVPLAETTFLTDDNLVSLKCFVMEIPIQANISALFEVSRIVIFYLPLIDQMEVEIFGRGGDYKKKKWRIFCHYVYDDTVLPVVNLRNDSVFHGHSKGERVIGRFRGNNLRALKRLKIGFTSADSHWDRLKVSFKPDDTFVTKGESTIDLTVPELIRFFESA